MCLQRKFVDNYGETELGRLAMSQKSERTRRRIIAAVIEAMNQGTFDPISTRDIAERAGVRQGLLSYHFKSKDEMWRTAVAEMYAAHDVSIKTALGSCDRSDPKDVLHTIREQFVRFSATHPAFLRVLIQFSSRKGPERDWFIENHLQKTYDSVRQALNPPFREEQIPHLFYIIAGACGAAFAAGEGVTILTGVDLNNEDNLKQHLEILRGILVPGD